MRPHVLIFTLFVIASRAATIPDKDVEFERKITEVIKDVLSEEKVPENSSSEQELIDQANSVKDVENNLRNRVQVADIPVKVVVEDVKPVLKSDCEKETNEVVPENEENVDIKRVEIDLKNPGEPQRQEHDSQSPEHFTDGQEGLTAVKQEVINSQNVFQGGVQGIQDQIQSWWAESDNESLQQIRKSIDELQTGFQNQISKLNETVQRIWQPYSASVPSIKSNVASSLQYLETNVKSGVKALSDGVEAISSVRQENKPEEQTQKPPERPWQQYFQSFTATIQQGFQNLTNNIQSNYGNMTQNSNNGNNATAADGGSVWQNIGGVFNVFRPQATNQTSTVTQVQSDEGAPQPPNTLWGNLQNNIQNYFRPNGGSGVQSDTPVSQPANNRPILNAIQQIPLFQGVANFINPQSNQPAQVPQAQKPEDPKPEASQEGSNAVPTESKPDKEQEKEKPVVTQTAQSGPIKQLIEKNPIVQGIAGAVQRIQHTVNNPEKPRDADVDAEKGFL